MLDQSHWMQNSSRLASSTTPKHTASCALFVAGGRGIRFALPCLCTGTLTKGAKLFEGAPISPPTNTIHCTPWDRASAEDDPASKSGKKVPIYSSCPGNNHLVMLETTHTDTVNNVFQH